MEALELVPMVVDRVDLRIVRPAQFVLELKIIGRISEDEIGAAGGQSPHGFDAIAFEHPVECVDQLDGVRHVPPDSSTGRGQ